MRKVIGNLLFGLGNAILGVLIALGLAWVWQVFFEGSYWQAFTVVMAIEVAILCLYAASTLLEDE